MKIFVEPVKPKRKRYNKNKKKAWRKKIDISDIEAVLEDKRREERFGGPLEERVSEEFFSLDYGTSDITKKVPKHQSTKLLKCHQFINGLPGAKAISKKGGIVKQKEKRVIKKAKKLSENTLSAVKKKEALSKQRKASIKKRKLVQEHGDEFCDDIWGKKLDTELEKYDEVGKTYMKDALDYVKERTKKKEVRIPNSIQEKTSLLPSVVVPKAGASYNPTYEDHQNLLKKALEFEVVNKLAKLKEKRMIEKYVPSKKDGITEEEQMDEMLQGLPFGNNEMVEYESDDNKEESETTYNRGKKEKRSKQSRRKEKTLKIKEQMRLKSKELNQKESCVFRLKSYEKQIKALDAKMKRVQMKREKIKKESRYKPKKLSQYKFQEEEVFVPLGTELMGSVRKIEPLGNAMDSTFKNLRRRNVLETRVRVKRPKAKVRFVQKRGHKSDMKKIVESLKA